ncbi:30S ribosomal protein S21 [Candidatus Nomurabacteria bacterium]|uniref:Small ribosomal subunit protein bS21 n=1 Tax=Candidatus Dojkabacteria bacterium TaxID=2099670 RepID=A0A955I494_9BACT|nr:30S ribosomal protein S21 [Candidatus Dojkabacteria bacterium]MCB9789770.1 30S ribosomal protein S21 [Candidatus Nomurabacteria bacterium]MCB9803867.1 30S ribosomal protein S21 [Candidatus Nomurabacteria bacterium]
MAVIVHSNESIDSALKRLHREVLREKILETFRNRVYHIAPSSLDSQKRREYAKMKRRRRTAARRAK